MNKLIDINNPPTLVCKICGKVESILGFDAHLRYEDNIKPKDYYEKYYSLIDVKNNLLGTDVYVLLCLRKLFPNFNNDQDMFQYLYEQHNSSLGNLDEYFGYWRFRKMVKTLGINIKKKLSNSHKKNVSNGSLGKVLTEEHKNNQRKAYYNIPLEKRKAIAKAAANANKGRVFSEKSILKMIKNRKEGSTPFRGKGGFREDLGHFVRSTWEANIARVFNYLKFEYEFEPKHFFITMRDGRRLSYTPDFKVGNFWIEVKGYFMDDSKEKFELFQEQYPDEKIHLLDKDKYYMYQRKFKNIVAWES